MPRPSQQARIDALEQEVAALKAHQAEADATRETILGMVTQLHTALMIPQAGQNGKSLLERMAEVTVNIESGQRTANNLLGGLKWLSGLILAAGVIYAAWKMDGQPPKG